MRYLYKGKTKIGKIHMKTKVDTSFITAGPEDIVAGKKTINGNYQEITGTMDVNQVMTELTSDATATAADITAGKTGWASGKKLTGTTVRDISTLLMPNGTIRQYPINNSEIDSGDFITITTIPDKIYESTATNTEFNKYPSVNPLKHTVVLDLDTDTKLILYRTNNGIVCQIVFIKGENIEFGKFQEFTVGIWNNYMSAVKISENNILVIYDVYVDGVNDINNCIKITILDDEYNMSISQSYQYYKGTLSESKIGRINDTLGVILFIPTYNMQLSGGVVNIRESSISFGIIQGFSTGVHKDLELIPSSSSNKIIVSCVRDNIAIIRTYTANTASLSPNTVSGSDLTGDFVEVAPLSKDEYLVLSGYLNRSGVEILTKVVEEGSSGVISEITSFVSFDSSITNVSMIKIITLDNNTIIAVYKTENNNIKYRIYDISISSNKLSLTPGSFFEVPYQGSSFEVLSKITSNYILSMNSFINEDNTGYTTLGILKVNNRTITNTNGIYSSVKYAVDKYTTGSKIKGIANTSGLSGDIIDVILP